MAVLELLHGDCRTVMATLPAASVQCCITSPAYYGLRDYGVDGQLGLEATPEAYVANMVAVFREVRRVLRDDGTLWLNLGDSYAGSVATTTNAKALKGKQGTSRVTIGTLPPKEYGGVAAKNLVGIPWRVAFALQADGWYLRSDIIWHKPNPMPESVTDRPTKSHEYIFLLTKSARYYYDNEAVKEAGTRNRRSVWTVTTKPFKGAHFATFPPKLIEPCILAGTSAKGCCSKCGKSWKRIMEKVGVSTYEKLGGKNGGYKKMREESMRRGETGVGDTRDSNGNIVWYEATPKKFVGWQPDCVCGLNPIASVVLDPFSGAGTTGVVAIQHGRRYIGIELNADYLDMSRKRIQLARNSLTMPLFA